MNAVHDIHAKLSKYPTYWQGQSAAGSKTGAGNAAFIWRVVGYLIEEGKIDPEQRAIQPAIDAVLQFASSIPDAPEIKRNLQEVGKARSFWRAKLRGEIESEPPSRVIEGTYDMGNKRTDLKSINRILYGPPGTGKTYRTIDESLSILDVEFLTNNANNRAELKRRFDELADAGLVRFVTFHQSFSYEDFVEGIRASTDEATAGLRYEVEDGVFKQLCDAALLAAGSNAEQTQPLPHVLIIDEINRGNISRIFGELITLIEPSKRKGMPEALEVVLPYSRKRFSVPANLHLIGTMNTADRSLAGLDIALRRRFEFVEMLPDLASLKDITVKGIPIDRLLAAMNERIEALLGRDYMLGHAYFLRLREEDTLTALGDIFKRQVLPLLQEYFFEDWQKIALVLNDQQKKDTALQFLQKREASEGLFGPGVDLPRDAHLWSINADAFKNPAAYKATIQAPAAE